MTRDVRRSVIDKVYKAPVLASVPEVAVATIAMCNRPDVDIEKLARLISSDTSLAAKMLQLANSAFYRGRNKVTTVRGALVRLGLKVSRISVLGFSLAARTRREAPSQFDIERFWRYALSTGSAARLVAERVCPHRKDEAFAAGLMQDIGVLALECAVPEEYDRVLAAQCADPTAELWEIEAQTLGTTHLEVGAELLRRWNLPPEIYEPIRRHHDAEGSDGKPAAESNGETARILRLAAKIARLFNDPGKGLTHEIVMARAHEEFGLSAQAVTHILEKVESAARNTARLFELDPASTLSYDEIKAQAAHEIARLSIAMEERANALKAKADDAAHRVRTLEKDKVKLARQLGTDELTGVLVRREFLKLLEGELLAAARLANSVCILFMDIDSFKAINRDRGHLDGDAVLKGLGQFLQEGTRQGDAVARYGGDEFVAMLPMTDLESAMKLAERLRIGVQEASKEWLPEFAGITLSVGLYCCPIADCAGAEPLLHEADKCMFAAKAAGGNCTRYNTPTAPLDASPSQPATG